MIFSRRKLQSLQDENLDLKRHNSALQAQVEYLVRTIRSMDDKIFSMGQCTSWESMRPRFNQLHDEMTARKVAESNRIRDLMRTELVETYTDPKLIQSQKVHNV